MTMGIEEASEQVVREFCDALTQHDIEAVRGFFTDDVVYHNIPMDPAVGIEDAMTFLEGFFGMFESTVIEIVQIAATGNIVLTERVDTLTLGGVVGPLPVMGTFELRDGKISAWRDYFDMGQITAMLTPPA
jgi:limonene-1,2-epoxide hydrolase